MTKVGFYLLQASAEQALQSEQGTKQASDVQVLYACRLVEKAVGQNLKVYIHCNDQTQAKKVSAQLWALKPESFLAHELISAELGNPNSILLGWPERNITDLDNRAAELKLGKHAAFGAESLIVNLADSTPAFVGRFSRSAEIVSSDEASKVKGRERYRHYKDRGYPLDTHKINS